MVKASPQGRRRRKENMSYCVNCGVQLDDSAKTCVLCKTPVINPSDLKKMEPRTPFPQEKGQVETVKRKDVGILLTAVLLAIAVTCGLLNAFVFKSVLWSLAVIGVCVILWVMMIPVVIHTRQSVYVSLLFDGLAVLLYLFMLTFMIKQDAWLWSLGMPLVVFITAMAEALAFCIRKLPRSFLTTVLYIVTDMVLLCVGIEVLIDRSLGEGIALGWSAVVLTVGAVVDIVIITLLSDKRLRNAVRRRLHF